MSKVLVTGADGQLGQELVEVFNSWQIVPTDFHNLDITNKEQANKVLKDERPDWIIHAAAWTDVEGCAENPEKAMLINGEGTKNLAEAAKDIGASLLYISTNEVFDGKKAEPYVEIDQTNPINPYAVSKLAGEKAVSQILGESSVIVRTSWVYGPKGKSNFPLKILEAAKNNSQLQVVDDEVATPTYAPDLAKWIFELVKKHPSGIYHLVNSGYCSRYDWAVQILKDKGIKTPVKRAKLKNYTRKSTPPAFSPLSIQKAKKIGINPRGWQESSREYLTTI